MTDAKSKFWVCWLLGGAVSCQLFVKEPAPPPPIEVGEKLPDGEYKKVGEVACKVDEPALASPAKTQACYNELKVEASQVEADVVVVVRKGKTPTNCNHCLVLIGAAYQRVLPWMKMMESARNAASSSEPEKAPAELASGSGFIVSPDGLVLTAQHVIDEARSIHITLSDGRHLMAKVQRQDKEKDVAVLRIEGAMPGYLSLAPADSVRVGDPVWAMGYPAVGILGFAPKFTDGAVSSLTGLGDAPEVYQITVPVQPGNSGGPLLDAQGHVVGVITSSAAAIPFFKATGSLPQGINWAVKSQFAEPLFEQPKKQSDAASRRAAVERTQRALCLIESVRGDGLLRAPEGFGEGFKPTTTTQKAFDALRARCDNGKTRACLGVAEFLIRECKKQDDDNCRHLRYALTVAHHACAVGETRVCDELRARE